jgi:glycosyltransferase involved in cell wall biosynthesis
MKEKLTIITPDLSNNCLGRAYVLWGLLKNNYDIEMVGPLWGREIWFPLKDTQGINYKVVGIRKNVLGFYDILTNLGKIEGQIIYASKPLFSSYVFGLLCSKIKNKRLILDIDDWQPGFIKEYYKKLPVKILLKEIIYALIYPLDNGSFLNILLSDILVALTKTTTVSNTFLKAKYGGVIIPHCRDEKIFDPGLYERATQRKAFGFEANKYIIMFMGSPRKYKGLEDLIDSVSEIKDDAVCLLIAGLDKSDYSNAIKRNGQEKLGNRLMYLNNQPFDKLPALLAAVDLVAIPQRLSEATRGQMPSKIYDAMAMAKPIVATAVSDIPETLADCGVVVKANDAADIKRGILYLYNNPEVAKELGAKARHRFLEEYNLCTHSEEICRLIDEIKE